MYMYCSIITKLQCIYITNHSITAVLQCILQITVLLQYYNVYYRSQYYYSCGRDSQISLVADRAKTAACTPRLEQLATPKEPVQQFRDRPHKYV